MSNQLLIFELEILFEKQDPDREEWHYFKVVAENHEHASKIVDKHDFGFEGVSWTEKTKYSVCKLMKGLEPTMIYTEPRIISYSFLGPCDEENDD